MNQSADQIRTILHAIQGLETSNVSKHVQLLREAEVLAREMPEIDIQIMILLALGDALAAEGQLRSQSRDQSLQTYETALKLIDQTPESRLRSKCLTSLGRAYLHRNERPRAEDIETAIDFLNQAVEILEMKKQPKEWILAHSLLAQAYRRRGGDRSACFQHAMASYEQALKACNEHVFPKEWADVQNGIGAACLDRIVGASPAMAEKAIQSFSAALRVFSRECDPGKWAMINSNMALAYRRRTRGNPRLNLRTALEHIARALEVYTEEQYPLGWARAQAELGSIYSTLEDDDRSQNRECAIGHFELSLRVFTREEFAYDWSRVQNAMGNVFRERDRGSRQDNIERALVHYGEALTVRTEEAFPSLWAETRHNIGNALISRTSGNRNENIEAAIEAFHDALRYRSRNGFPADWASTHNSIGNAYRWRVRGSRAANIEKAIAHYHLALAVRTSYSTPHPWATTKNNLGIAFIERLKGDRVDNYQNAIENFQAALSVRTRSSSPYLWAQTMHNLGASYLSIPGDQWDNSKRAIHYFEEALTVFSPEKSPSDWGMVQGNLGNALAARDPAAAIRAYQAALSVRPRSAFPDKWAALNCSLGNAFLILSKRDEMEHFDEALACFHCALEVYEEHTYPVEWAALQQDLGMACQWAADFTHERETRHKALLHFRSALRVYNAGIFPAQRREILHRIGLVLGKNGQWSEALVAFSEAGLIGESLLEQSFTSKGRLLQIEKNSVLFADAACVALRNANHNLALAYLEKSKARILAELLRDRAVQKPEVRKRLHAAHQLVLNLEGRIQESFMRQEGESQRLTADLRKARLRLKQVADEIGKAPPQAEPQLLESVSALIPPQAVAVVPVVSQLGSAILFIAAQDDAGQQPDVLWLESFTRKDLIGALLGFEKGALGGWMGAYLAFLENPQDLESWQRGIEKQTASLWTGLMGPVYDHLKHSFPGGSRVIFFPQGGLALLPLQAAWRNVDGRKKFFVDDYAFCSFPSFNVMKTSLGNHKESSVDQWSLLALGDPHRDLRWATSEAEAIAEVFREGRVELLRGKQVRRSTLMKLCPEFTHIHFGGHGFHHLEEPLKSGLELAHGDILSVVDMMYQLNLHNTRLITLSACETAVTRLIRIPDEGLGLPFGLLAAGASAVVGSLWPLADEASSLFMVHFYRQLVQEGALPIDALRASQLWLRQASRQDIDLFWAGLSQGPDLAASAACDAVENNNKMRPFASPYYWGGFSLIGW